MFNFIFRVINVILFLYLMMILISFDLSDPGWMQSQLEWNGSIYNKGGIIGAQIADFLFFCFGSVAYIIPIIILFYIWIIFIKKLKISTFQFLLLSIIVLILFILCCVLTQITFKEIVYFSSGGMIGNILYTIISTDHNIILHIMYILFYIGTISLIYFFYDYILFYFKIVQEKIVYFLYIIPILFFKKKYQKYCTHQQAYYSTHALSSVLLYKKNLLFQKFIYNSSKIYKKSIITSNITQQSLKCFKKFNNNYINKIRFISSNYDMSYQDKNIIKYWIPRTKFNTDYIDCSSYNTRYTSNSRCFNKHNLNKDIKNMQNNNVFSSIIQKKPYYYNNMHTTFPDINLLTSSDQKNIVNSIKFKKISQLIEKKLFEYRITANVVKIISGPVITRFDLNLSAGIKSSKITNLSRDLARSLSTTSIRVLEIVPGTPYVGLEIPNDKRDIVYLKDIINSNEFQKNNSPLALVFGKSVTGQPIVQDLRYMPHLLVAGTTGSGKSVGINAMIISILYKSTPEDVRFIMIDPKILELSIYENIPHLLKKVVTQAQDAESILQWCVKEMEHRYKLMSKVGVRNLENYNNYIEQLDLQKGTINYSKQSFNKHHFNDVICFSKKIKKLPYIVIIIDEFSDLMMTTAKTVETLIIRLTQKARAAGIHVILATQRPSVDVITGVIKANIPARIAFTVSSKIDSRTILGQSGAESLLGMGDMLYLPPNSAIPIRIHGAHITDTEIYSVTNFWKKQIDKYIQQNN